MDIGGSRKDRVELSEDSGKLYIGRAEISFMEWDPHYDDHAHQFH